MRESKRTGKVIAIIMVALLVVSVIFTIPVKNSFDLDGKRQNSKAPGNVIIVLDPGHGGSDSGASRTWDNVEYIERDMNLTMAEACKEELEKTPGVTVLMTRTDNTSDLHGTTSEDISWRCTYAHENNADLFVSIHCNSSTNTESHGAEVEIPNTSYNMGVYNVGKTVAESILKELESLGITNNGAKIRNSENNTQYSDGSIADYYGIVRGCKQYGIPGMIVEHAFVSNYSDATTYFGTNEKLKELGRADAKGIISQLELLKNNRVDNGLGGRGWVQSGDSWIYYDEDDNIKTGFFTLTGNTYYGSSNGEIVYGWQLINGYWYYFDEEDGIMNSNKWMVSSSGGWQYLGEDGKMTTGVTKTKDDNYYLFSSDGIMLTGWQYVDGSWYYATSSGILYVDQWLQSGGNWFHFGEDGKMATEWTEIKDKWYYFTTDGVMKSGWQFIGNSWFYFNSNGEMYEEQWAKFSGDWYYFDENGAMAWGWKEIKDKWSYFLGSGVMQTGWVGSGAAWYYIDDDGYMLTDAWKKIKGDWYYFNEDGLMVIGWVEIKDKWYYMNGAGVLTTGWNNINGIWYYMDDVNGNMVTNGWVKDTSGKYYFMKEDGTMAINEIVTDAGYKYYIDESGFMVSTKWIPEGKLWYYANTDGTLLVNSWINSGTDYYYMGEDGLSVTGLYKIGEDYYYFGSDGIMATTDVVDGDNTYIIDSDGKVTNPDEPDIETDLHKIMGESDLDVTAEKLAEVYNANVTGSYPSTELSVGGAADITTFCQKIIDEATAEGVKPEVVFAQIMNETAWLQFGGDVKVTQFNFAGLGATGGGEPGLSFTDVSTGIRAEVQHLKAYASTADLVNESVDPRFQYVERGVSPYVEYLGQQENPSGKGWATAENYGGRLLAIMELIK